jgi:hypothetical protein
MIYKMLPKINEFEEQVFARIDDDGKCRITCVAKNPEFQKQILADEAQLQDADGKTMTAKAAKEYVATLP